jgi:hypothetical protein
MRSLVFLLLIACSGRTKSAPATVPLNASISAESAEAAYDAKNWPECAAQWTSVAEKLTGEPKALALYDAACCYALDGRVDPSVASLEAALDAGYWDHEHAAVDDDLAKVREHAKWPAIEARAKANFEAFEKSLGDAALRKELLELVAKDQAARAKADNRNDVVMALDKETAARMKDIVAKHGWPGKSLVHVDGAHAAWMLVQHADSEPAFQKDCLAKMEPLVQTGEVSGQDFAYLFDRVAVNAGKPQRYGTQFGDDGELAPLEDSANVDARRKAVGLGTLVEYQQLVRKLEAQRK